VDRSTEKNLATDPSWDPHAASVTTAASCSCLGQLSHGLTLSHGSVTAHSTRVAITVTEQRNSFVLVRKLILFKPEPVT